MAALCMCVLEQEGGQPGTPGTTQRSTKIGSVLLLSHEREMLKNEQFAGVL